MHWKFSAKKKSSQAVKTTCELIYMAERVGFEPTELLSSQLFESCTLNRSDISPYISSSSAPQNRLGFWREQMERTQIILIVMIVEKSLKINAFFGLGFQNDNRISSPLSRMDSSGIFTPMKIVQRTLKITIIQHPPKIPNT